MIALRTPDGMIRIDASPEEASFLLAVLVAASDEHGWKSALMANEALDRRVIADRVKRSAHANRRIAGELDAQAARHADLRDLALDMQRALRPLVGSVSASEPS